MGISKKAFEASQGFGNIHPGEDPDLSIRLWKLGYDTRLFSKAYVYHKRRIDWDKFTLQVTKFGKARPILNSWYPEYNKVTFFFPTLFILGLSGAVVLFLFGINFPLMAYAFYFLAVLMLASWEYKSLVIGFLSVIAVYKQFTGYGVGFLKSYIKVILLQQKPEIAFPELFFKLKS
jgi:GT2 family glycosyltransferase